MSEIGRKFWFSNQTSISTELPYQTNSVKVKTNIDPHFSFIYRRSVRNATYLCFLCIAMISPDQILFEYCVVVNSKMHANASKNSKIIFANMLLIWTIGKPLYFSIASGNLFKLAPPLSHKLHTTLNKRLHSISSLWHPWISNMHELHFSESDKRKYLYSSVYIKIKWQGSTCSNMKRSDDRC